MHDRGTVHFKFHTPHFIFHNLHTALNTIHSPLYILHLALYTLHFTLYIMHVTLRILRFALSILHFFSPLTPDTALYTLHSKLCTPHSTLGSAGTGCNIYEVFLGACFDICTTNVRAHPDRGLHLSIVSSSNTYVFTNFFRKKHEHQTRRLIT